MSLPLHDVESVPQDGGSKDDQDSCVKPALK